jgi:tripartite-type tricarboxylate transporter receptor subunit TctC
MMGNQILRQRRTARVVCSLAATGALAVSALMPASPAGAQSWEPTKPIQFIIPAGTGGGADQMARFIQGVVAKNNLAKQPIITVNKGGGAGAEGFLEVKKSDGDPHNIIITLSNLFTTPLATGVPFGWKDLTPVAMLALDQFILWVPADAPYTTAKEYISAVKAAPDKSYKMGGTGSKQEDQIITVALEKLTAPKKIHLHSVQGRRRRGSAARWQAHKLLGEQSDRGCLAVEGRGTASVVHL